MKFALCCASALCASVPAWASAPLVTAEISDHETVTLANERPVAFHAVTDMGALADTHALPHVTMVLKRAPEQQAAFDKLVADQQNPKSASYHKWLSPGDLAKYAPAAADIAKTVSWLQSHGLKVNSVSPSGMMIDFGGTAKQVSEAFHTTLHNVSLHGEMHMANMTDPAIPAALVPVVRGATLSNFFPKPNLIKAKPAFTSPSPDGTFYYIGPADFATIYNVKPLYTGNNAYSVIANGAGVTITVVEQTDILPADWNSFRTQFKLSGFKKGTLTLTHPGDCGDPGFTADEGEAALDAEWSNAVAPNAKIIEASCPGSETSFGVETALQNLVELGTKASIFSISYGESEVGGGLVFLSGWANLVEEGASEGISIIVSSGDSGSSSSYGVTSTGLAVSGLASNPYDTVLGGTDFYDTATNTVSKYWNTKNTGALGSAKSYIPEMTWNNSCASTVLYKFLGAKDANAACNNTTIFGELQEGVGGSGGQSLIYAKPDWQNIGVPGMPADGVRDLPDVSLFASNGTWGHAYVFCMSDTTEEGTACDYTNATDTFYNSAGGTSFAAPAFAGAMALVVETYGYKVGNPAPLLYQLAKAQFTNPLLMSRCNSTLGSAISTACVFNNVTVGNIAEPCVKGTLNCHTNGPAPLGVGVLTASTKAPYVNAFPTTPGYSLATGLGTINVTNLVINYVP